MSREVRTFAEGSLRWVQASGTGGWQTGSAAITALVGFVQAGTTFPSARNLVTVMERGYPHHHKFTDEPANEVQFSYLQAVTGNLANPATASGVSTPQVHFQIRSQDNEVAAASAQYWLLTNCVLTNRVWAEAAEGNTLQETWRALSIIGPTASGYLA